MPRGRAVPDEVLLGQLRRVAGEVDGPVTTTAVDRQRSGQGDVSSATIRRRFRSWWDALERAGLSQRYRGPSKGHRFQPGRGVSTEEVVAELRRVAGVTGKPTVTERDLVCHSPTVQRHLVRLRFGSMGAGLAAAGLVPDGRQSRWTERELLDNAAALWRHYGRRPTQAELDRPPSRVTRKAYRRRFGSVADAITAGQPQDPNPSPASPTF